MTRAAAEKVEVVLAEDHELFRAGMSRAIAQHPELKLVAEASDGLEALAAIVRLQPAAALVDVRMPGIDGLELCRRVSRCQPPLKTKVVLVTAHLDEVSASAAKAAGAVRVLSKSSSRAQLCAELVAGARWNGPSNVAVDDARELIDGE